MLACLEVYNIESYPGIAENQYIFRAWLGCTQQMIQDAVQDLDNVRHDSYRTSDNEVPLSVYVYAAQN